MEAREHETSESISDSEDENLHEQIEEKLALLRRRREQDEKLSQPFKSLGDEKDVKVTA